ncbi:MAG: hypothetical protein NVSMB29_06890 [Candidatus Dormibacteria bacterium]
MGFLRRRRERQPAPEAVRVGVRDHLLVLNADAPGIAVLADLQGYVGSLSPRVSEPRPDGTDSVALQSAKLDLAEMVEDWTSVSVLALEELEQRSLLGGGGVPERPSGGRIDTGGDQYAFIQAAHRRAEQRLIWLGQVDALLRELGAALLPPDPRQRE